MDNMPAVGDIAPDFELTDDEGRTHRLSQRKGHFTVVYFYPADDTPGCTKEACAFRDAHTSFGDADTEVWGISPQGAASKAAFRAKYGLPFTLLADENHAVADSYGSWAQKEKEGRTYWGVARNSFLVDPAGRISHVWTKVQPENHAAEVLEALNQARAAIA
jgi:thioredoxin-dependent peroxiredoxin